MNLLTMTAQEIVSLFNLKLHPKELGFYRETYRADGMIRRDSLPDTYKGDRSFSTSIFYLLTAEAFSAFHKIPSDEVYHFYIGDPVQIVQLLPDGQARETILGHDLIAGDQVQLVVPGNTWQGMCLRGGGKWALLGCTVAPGFDFADYQQGYYQPLLKLYPEYEELIARLTRE